MVDSGGEYSSVVGFIYVFNLIVGAGTLAMPKAFSEAGVLISAVIVVVLAFLSFLTCTFMVESMAIANAVLTNKDLDNDENEDTFRIPRSDSEATNLLVNSDRRLNAEDSFELKTKVEMGEMAHLFFNKIGLRLFYLCIVVYLYGDLAIYATAVPKSLGDVLCGFDKGSVNDSVNGTHNETSTDKQCWGIQPTTVYRIFVAVFALLICPFAFTNVQKTKYIQYITTVLRWLAFGTMIVIAIIRLGQGKANGKPSVASFGGIPDLFGATVYSFMCQHSLPSLITPLKTKQHLTKILALDLAVALLFYSLLSFSAIFTFESSEIEDVYTLSFKHITAETISTFLALYPVFALSANFPIISITLRENLKALVRKDGEEFRWAVEKFVFPLCAVVPPILVALCTQNVELLVSVTGSYAGAGVQYVIPTMLLYCGRRSAQDLFGSYENKHTSLFNHRYWIWAMLLWTGLCVAIVTAYNIKTRI